MTAPDITTNSQAQERFRIRSSEFFAITVASFEDQAKQKLIQSANSVLAGIASATQSKKPEEWPIPQILELVGTNDFRDLSLDLEETDLDVLAEKPNDLAAQVIDEKLQILGHRWAVYIHGHVQTRLSAAALMIEEAQKKSDFASISQAINILREILDDPTSGFSASSQSLSEEIQSRLNPWKGLLEIELSLQPELANLASHRNQDIGEILGEAIANAVRHGQARRIKMSVALIGHAEVSVTMTDDSMYPPNLKESKSGLGTKIFNSVSDGRWMLTRDEKAVQTTFKIIINIDEAQK
jgi:two-component sensor histidine kinase